MMKHFTLTLTALLFSTYGLYAQETISADKANATETTVEAKTDADVASKTLTKDEEAEAAIAKMKEDRAAKIEKKRQALIERAKKQGLVTKEISEKDKLKRQKQIEKQRKAYNSRKEKLQKEKEEKEGEENEGGN